MTETVNGLLTQKANSPPPTVGQVKSFAWEQRTSKAGKPWIKIKNETPEYGGKPCRIIQAQQTDFQDAHGNLSYNLEIEPVNGAQTQPKPQTYELKPTPAGPVYTKLPELDARQLAIIRQHSQTAALGVLTLKATLNELTIEDLTPAKLRSLADFFDTDVKEAANAG